MGLALCSEIARLHGTTLTFESKEGKGTSVSFWLELQTSEGADGK